MQQKTLTTAEIEDWVRRNRHRLIARALQLLGDEHEAEDVVQDTLKAVYVRSLEGQVRNLHRYAFRAVTVNALKRRARRKGWLPLAEDDCLQQAEGPAEEPTLDPATLEQAIADLPLPQQAVIRMRYYVGMTFRQIARDLSISINTAASRSRYALAALRKKLTAANRKEKP